MSMAAALRRHGPSWAIVLFLFGPIILLGLHPQVGQPMVPHAPMLALICQVGAGLAGMALLATRQPVRAVTMLTTLAALAILAAASAWWSIAPLLVLKRVLLVFGPSAMLALLVFCDPEPQRSLRQVTIGLSALVVALVVVALLLYGEERTMMSLYWIQEGRFGPLVLSQKVTTPLEVRFIRVSSLTGNPNSLALYAMICAGLLAARPGGRVWNSPWILVTWGLIAIGLIVSFSKAALIACAVMALTAGMAVASFRARLVLAAAAAITAIAAAGLVSLLMQDANFVASLNDRMHVWSLLAEHFLRKPWLGNGFGVSEEVLRMGAGTADDGAATTAHSLYLGLAVELGLAGLALLALLLAAAAGAAWRAGGGAGTGAFVGLVAAIAIHQMAEFTLFRYDPLHFLLLYVLLVAARLQEIRSSTNSLQGQPSSPAAGAGLANERTRENPCGARNETISSAEADS
jgi:O-antigen ligase